MDRLQPLIRWFRRVRGPDGADLPAVMFVAAGVGMVVGGFAVAFRLFVRAMGTLFYGPGFQTLAVDAPPVIRSLEVLTVAAIGLVILTRFAGDAAIGEGVPRIVKALQQRVPVLGWAFGPAKAATAALTLASGGSVGREGPIVAISGWIGVSTAKYLQWPGSTRRLLLAAGAAAGIAGTFNAPIAATFFSLEILLGTFAMDAFGPVVVASVFATLVSRSILGNSPAFTLPTVSMLHPWEIIAFFVLGAVSGLVAVTFTRVRALAEVVCAKIPLPALYRPLMVLPLMAVFVATGLNGVLGNGYDLITALYEQKVAWELALVLIPMKILATSLVLGGRGSGGIFAPSLVIGACVGAVVHALAVLYLPESMAGVGTYVLVGAGAVVAGVTHGPLTSFLILFEMTGSYSLIIPLLAAVAVSSLVARGLDPRSIYTIHLPILPDANSRIADFTVADAMSTVLPESILDPDTSLKAAVGRLGLTPLDFLWVVDSEGKYLGALGQGAIPCLLDEGSSSDLRVCDALDTPPILDRALPLQEALNRFLPIHVDALPVVEEGHLIGQIEERTLLAILDRESHQAGNQMVKFIQPATEGGRVDFVEMPHQVRVAEIRIPKAMDGTRVVDLKLPTTYRAFALVRKRSEPTRIRRDIVHGDTILAEGDRLVLFAPNEGLLGIEAMIAAREREAEAES